MGLLARNGINASAALIGAHNDTRKGAAIAMSVIYGTITLNASGAATITNAAFTALTKVSLYLTATGGTALSVNYKQTASAGSVTIQGVTSAGANATTDQSTFSYMAETPLYHGDQTASAEAGDWSIAAQTLLQVTAATAVDLATSITMANQIRQVLNLMMADAVAHLVADTTNPVATAIAVDLTSVEALLNAEKTAFNAHLAQAGVHITNDTTNTVATANATDLPSSEALANALKTAINAHLASAPQGESVTVINT